jgi:hypothetical protein
MNAYRFVELQREVSSHSIPSFALKTESNFALNYASEASVRG